MKQLELNNKLHYTLRIAVAMCFIGHGAFGIVTKPIWCNYFGVFGIGHDLSYQLMPVVGCVDLALGIMMLFYPVRAIPAWLVVWGALTALLRPLSGEPFAEFIERGGNFGAPLALLFLAGGSRNIRGWFTRINPDEQPATLTGLASCLKVFAFFILLGHGWLNLIEKKSLIDQYTSIGFSSPALTAQIIGLAEVIAAFIVLIKPIRALIFIFFLWKMMSEIFYPHYGLFEWIERAGSYGVLLSLWLIAERKVFLKWPGNLFSVKLLNK